MSMTIVNTQSMEIPDLTGTNPGASLRAMAVLTKDDIGKFAAYCGIVDLPYSEKMTEKQYESVKEAACTVVMYRGKKLSHRAALSYFPFIPGNEYRD